MPSDLNKDRKLIAGRWVRWNDERAASAYARGLWTRDTLADAFERPRSRRRNGWCSSMAIVVSTAKPLAQAKALAQAMLARAPTGSVVSFMLPNWHEAAVIYLAATLGRNGGEPDSAVAARSRVAFHSEGRAEPPGLRAVDSSPARLCRDDEPRDSLMDQPPEVVVVRGDAGSHTSYAVPV